MEDGKTSLYGLATNVPMAIHRENTIEHKQPTTAPCKIINKFQLHVACISKYYPPIQKVLHSRKYIILKYSTLTAAFANGKIAPIKKTPNIGPVVAPVKLSDACKTCPPILSVINDTPIAATPYRTTGSDVKILSRIINKVMTGLHTN